jgi:uncharacterized protein (DUF1330 family)
MSDHTNGGGSRKGYAVGYLRQVVPGDDLVTYLETIDATLQPYGGRFVVHGGELRGLEGEWDGAIVILEFPDVAQALAWYESPQYQAILPLRLNNSTSIAAVVEGVPAGYRAAEFSHVVAA